MTAPGRGAIQSGGEVRRMFARIVRRYDLMNRIMTGGQDVRWRKRAVRYAREAGSARALDVATGTGDLALALADGGFRGVIGLDFVPAMIAAAESKRNGRAEVAFVAGDAMRLPFRDGSFDAVTVSFGLRNMADYEGALREMARVIRPGGRLVCLELTPFRAPLVGALFDVYLRRVVPAIGGRLTGDRDAYEYLPESVANFPDAQGLAALMRRAGFAEVRIQKAGGGAIALHVAAKPDRTGDGQLGPGAPPVSLCRPGSHGAGDSSAGNQPIGERSMA